MNTSEITVIILVALIVIGGMLYLAPTRLDVSRLRNDVEQLQLTIDTQKENLNEVRSDIEALKKGDPALIERISREKYGYSRAGEQIYRLDYAKPE